MLAAMMAAAGHRLGAVAQFFVNFTAGLQPAALAVALFSSMLRGKVKSFLSSAISPHLTHTNKRSDLVVERRFPMTTGFSKELPSPPRCVRGYQIAIPSAFQNLMSDR